MIFDLNFAHALGEPLAQAGLKTYCEDFVVIEDLGFEPAGSGEHWLVQIEKRDDNTPWAAKQLARLCGVTVRDVGYCGMKDRRALTRQWFSVYLPKGTEPEWSMINSETLRWLQSHRHSRKLRRGEHKANYFEICLRDCADFKDDIESRLNRIIELGVPNYFGEQRFGRDASNLKQVTEVLAKRGRKGTRDGMVLSAARSFLFNQVLSARVKDGSWNQPLAQETEPTGPLWGRGRSGVCAAVAGLEAQAMQPWAGWLEGLEHAGLSQDRRPLVMRAQALRWQWQGAHLKMSFSLPPGQFATVLLRELAQLKTPPTSVI